MINAQQFHSQTKHSRASLGQSRWRMDFANKPFPFKVYKDTEIIDLPKEFDLPNKQCLDALINHTFTSEGLNFDKKFLASILFFTGGVSRILHGNFMRTASATGALYPIEIYALVQHFSDLEDGLYHFSTGDFTLNQLRKGDYFSYVAQNSSDPERIQKSSIVIILSSIAWRNSWKYQERSYRHWFWDGGVMLSNLLAISSAFQLESKVLTAFKDKEINTLLGLKENKEAVIALIPLTFEFIPDSKKHQEGLKQEINPLHLHILNISPKEYNFPLIWDIHESTSFQRDQDLKNWSDKVKNYKDFKKVPKPSDIKLNYSNDNILNLEQVILQRGSTTRFAKEPISKDQLLTILKSSNSGFESDFFPDSNSTTIECYLNVHDVEGVEPGAYYYNSIDQTLEIIKEGQFNEKTAFLCLGQQLFGTTHVTIFLLSNMNGLLKKIGDRAYRVTQLEGSIIAGKIYLASFAINLGARGTTFFDDDVVRHFLPHAEGKDVMMAVGIGKPAYKNKKGKKLGPIFTREQLISDLENYLSNQAS